MAGAAKIRRSLCFIRGCRKNFQLEKTSYFSAKKDEIETWRKIVPGLNQKTKLCARHFDDSDVKKGIVVDGKFYMYKSWRLRPGAVPKHFLGDVICGENNVFSAVIQPPDPHSMKNVNSAANNNLRVYRKESSKLNNSCSQISVTRSVQSTPTSNDSLSENNKNIDYQNTNPDVTIIQKSLNREAGEIPLSPIQPLITPIYGPDHDYITTTLQPEKIVENIPSAPYTGETVECRRTRLQSNVLTKAFIDDVTRAVLLPTSDWFWVLNTSRNQASCSIHIPMANDQLLIKTVVITSSSSVTFLLNGKPVNGMNLHSTFESHEELYKTLCKFHSANVCRGVNTEKLKNLKLTSHKSCSKDADGVIRSKHCTILTTPNDECSKCKNVRFYLQRHHERLSKMSEEKDIKVKALKRKLKQSSESLVKRKKVIDDLKAELTKAKKELQAKSISHLMQQLNPMEQTILKLFVIWSSLPDKESGGRSARYEDSIMNHCSLLWLKNPTTYNFLRKHKIIPLPSLTTVSNYIKSKKDQLESIDSEFVRNLIGLSPKANGKTTEAPDTEETADQVVNIELDVILGGQ